MKHHFKYKKLCRIYYRKLLISDLKERDKKKIEEWHEESTRMWAADNKKRVGFFRIEYVSPAIVRCDPGECYEEYVVIYPKGCRVIGVGYIENYLETINVDGIELSAQEKKVFGSKEQFREMLIEAIKVLEKGRKLDYKKEDMLECKLELKKTPVKIRKGKLSSELEKILTSVKDIPNMENRFRRLCLRHYKKINVAEQGYSRFYLHSDEDSFAIFDVVVWAYLHISDSYSVLVNSWEGIINGWCMNKGPLADEYIQYFSIGGAEKFFKEEYWAVRMKEQRIHIIDDKIIMDEVYVAQILEYIKSV